MRRGDQGGKECLNPDLKGRLTVYLEPNDIDKHTSDVGVITYSSKSRDEN